MKTHKLETTVNVLNYNELSDIDKKLIESATHAADSAYAPYSKFNVGAAIMLENNIIVTGSNQENAAYPSGLCAERVAMFYANAQYPDVKPLTLAIVAKTNQKILQQPITPCGACRQVLLETQKRFNSNIRILLTGAEQIYEINSVTVLLPLVFDNDSLNW